MNNKRHLVSIHLSFLLILVGCSDGSQPAQGVDRSIASAPGTMDRSVLPIPDPVFPKITELDARNATAPPPFSVTAPDGAPVRAGSGRRPSSARTAIRFASNLSGFARGPPASHARGSDW